MENTKNNDDDDIIPEDEENDNSDSNKNENNDIVNIAVIGCCHGELELIYKTLENVEFSTGKTIDLVLCCGDFQSCRNMSDLESLNCPNKYKHMKDFHLYYSGEKTAPFLTIFIGGNHEAVCHNMELYYGGWAARNIYFLGQSGCVEFCGIKIAGVSGIEKKYDYFKGYFERMPFNENEKRSIYHIRSYELSKLSYLTDVDIFLSHEWPKRVWKDLKIEEIEKQIGYKKHLIPEIKNNKLGSINLEYMLKKLQPNYWFSAHLHCKFEANYSHSEEKVTKFLALDKALKKKKFIKILQIPKKGNNFCEKTLYYNKEWLSILRASHDYFPLGRRNKKFSSPEIFKKKIEEEKEFIENRIKTYEEGKYNDLSIHLTFKKEKKEYDNNLDGKYTKTNSPTDLNNNQRTKFLSFLDISDNIEVISNQNDMDEDSDDEVLKLN